MEIFATGLRMGESPRWHDGRLWVCDWVAGEVLSYDAAGHRTVELTMTGLPFSVDWLPDGRTVLTCTEGVVTADEDGSLTPYGAMGQAWNEIVVDPAGNTFVNAAGFDLMGGEEPKPGFVWVVRPDGSSDAGGRRRVVPQRDGRHPRRRDADRGGVLRALPDGVRHRRRRHARQPPRLGRPRRRGPRRHLPRCRRCCWYADVPHRQCVRVAEGGEVLEVVQADRGCFACMLGGEDGRTLYVVANEWGGTSGIGQGEPSGQLLTHRAPSPHAGRP